MTVAAVHEKIAVRLTTDADRAEALATGTKALALIVSEEAEKLDRLRELLLAAQAAATDLSVIDEPRVAQPWKLGLETLDKYYYGTDSGGVAMNALGELADEAEMRLSVVSGRRVFVSGGEWSDIGEWCCELQIDVNDAIAEYGEVES